MFEIISVRHSFKFQQGKPNDKSEPVTLVEFKSDADAFKFYLRYMVRIDGHIEPEQVTQKIVLANWKQNRIPVSHKRPL